MGHFAFCPHLNTAHFERELKLKELAHARYIEGDLRFLSFFDALVLVENWETSWGAKQEKLYAERHGIPVFYSVAEFKNYEWMTPEPERHLFEIKRRYCREVDKKYRAGQKEHGGNLWLKDQTKRIAEEAIDQFVYIFTLLWQIKSGIFPVKNALEDKDETCERCGTIHSNGNMCRGSED